MPVHLRNSAGNNPRVSHTRAEIVRAVERAREESAEVLATVRHRKRDAYGRFPGVSPWGLTRAENGDETSFLYRLVAFLIAQRELGAPEQSARRVLAFLEGWVDELYGDDTTPLQSLHITDLVADAAEDVQQGEQLAGVRSVGEYRASLEASIAAQAALLAGIRRAQGRRPAA